MRAPLLFLALPSAGVLVLLFLHFLKNQGARPTLAYFGAAFAYGWARGAWVESLSRNEYGSLAPYVINLPVVRLGAVSLQEIVGWSVAATVAWLIADRLLRRLDVEPSPCRVAALASLVLSSICLAVETAAIESGWWVWTIKQTQRPFLGRVPLVGLLDWGFVSFDFLLPYLVFKGSARLATRIASLMLFPLHFYFHPWVTPLPEPVPLAWNDLVHAAIFTFVLLQAVGEKGKPALPPPIEEKRRWIPLLSVLIIVLATAATGVMVAHRPADALASLPLLLLGVSAFALPSFKASRASLPDRPQAKLHVGRGAIRARGRVGDPSSSLLWSRIGTVVAVFSLLYMLRAPFHRHTRAFTDSMQRAVTLVNRGRIGDAEAEVRSGLGARPDQAGGHALLAQLLLFQRRTPEAREELMTALDLNPTHDTALILLTTLDLKEARWSQAAARAEYGKRVYPDRPEFIYQAGVAARQSAGPVEEAIAAARRGGPAMIQSLVSVATSLEDQATVRQLR